MIKRVDKLINAIDRVTIILGLISVSGSICLISLGVVARYLFQTTYSTFEELSVNLVMWAVMFFGGPVFIRGGHVGMDFIAEKLNGSLKATQQLIISMALLFICVIIFWKGMEIVQLIYQSGKTTHSGELKEWYLKIAIPIGGFLFGFYALGEMIKGICLVINPKLARQVFPSRSMGYRQQEGPGK
jgi:TRAP-type C4-dicarboxylate transport system permease small subunit